MDLSTVPGQNAKSEQKSSVNNIMGGLAFRAVLPRQIEGHGWQGQVGYNGVPTEAGEDVCVWMALVKLPSREVPDSAMKGAYRCRSLSFISKAHFRKLRLVNKKKPIIRENSSPCKGRARQSNCQ